MSNQCQACLERPIKEGSVLWKGFKIEIKACETHFLEITYALTEFELEEDEKEENKELGTKVNPYLASPEDWDKNGVPYGSYCLCDNCKKISRSTIIFDYYKLNKDMSISPLLCESCMMMSVKS